MLKTLKWVYSLGVKQERVRIASHLQAAAQGRRVTSGVMNDMFHDEMRKVRPNKRAIERLDFDRAVAREVEEIIDEIFRSNGEYVSTSLMFPEIEGKK
jgi:hypothetical protein